MQDLRSCFIWKLNIINIAINKIILKIYGIFYFFKILLFLKFIVGKGGVTTLIQLESIETFINSCNSKITTENES